MTPVSRSSFKQILRGEEDKPRPQLEDLLPPQQSDRATGESPTKSSDITAGKRQPTAAPKNDRPKTVTPARRKPSQRTGNRVVATYLDASVCSELRDFARRTDQTQGGVALAAVAANMDELKTKWRKEYTRRRSDSPFVTASDRKKRSTDGTYMQLRMSGVDIDTLDGMVEEWGAPSRSALLNEALRRHLGLT